MVLDTDTVHRINLLECLQELHAGVQEPPEEAPFEWTEDEIQQYFSSGGLSLPTKSSPTEDESHAGRGDEATVPRRIQFGGVVMDAPHPTALSNTRVGWAGPLRGVRASSPCRAELAALEWMTRKIHLRQDMLLLSDPGPRARHLALTLCAVLGREVEHLGVTRDTCADADLKQRREIFDGEVRYVSQSVVNAALHGRVLLLEGMERAERNVLPVLNNLLENREMGLEDGSFLLAAPRFDALLLEDGPHGVPHTAASLAARGLLRVSPEFIVIAIAAPVAKYGGNPLDPPLRSRFACHCLGHLLPGEHLERLCAFAPTVPRDLVRRLVSFAGAVNGSSSPPPPPTDGSRASTRPRAAFNTADLPVLPWFPEGGLESAVRLLAAIPLLRTSLAEVLHRVYPHSLISLDDAQKQMLAEACRELGLQPPESASAPALLLGEVAANPSQRRCVLRFEASPAGEGTGDPRVWSVLRLKEYLTRHGVSSRGLREKTELVEVARKCQHAALAAAECPAAQGTSVQLEAAGGGWRGIAGRAQRAGLAASQQRAVCAMLQDHAAAEMDLCVVGERGSGKTYVALGFAASLGYRVRQVFCYRDMTARDLTMRRATDARGNTTWRRSALVEAAVSGDLCLLDGIHRLAPGILYATLAPMLSDRGAALPDGTRLVSDEHWQDLLRRRMGDEEGARDRAEAELEAEGVTRVHPSFRVVATAELLRVGRYLGKHPADVRGALRRAFAASWRFVPAAAREPMEALLADVLMRQGVQRREWQGVAGGIEGGGLWGDEAPAEGAVGVRPAEIAVTQDHAGNTRVRIGAVTAERAPPERTELVPEVRFVATRTHVASLERMLADWALGQHLLLIGNQGVGKNKVVDRLLQLLRCEREYIQLHRDTTMQALTAAPSLVNGVLTYTDSPLVRAARHGRVLVVDEADKAPLEVVCVLKALVEDGELQLADGRTVRIGCHGGGKPSPAEEASGADMPASGAGETEGARDAASGKTEAQTKDDGEGQTEEFIEAHPGFRVVVLANRPGFPFLGNDFFRECGDVFSCHVLDNPEEPSELQLLQAHGPDVPLLTLRRLVRGFNRLRGLVEQGLLAYPYSTRELVGVVRHLQAFPQDGVEVACRNVFDFDAHEPLTMKRLESALRDAGLFTGPTPTAAPPAPINAAVLRRAPGSQFQMDLELEAPPPMQPRGHATAHPTDRRPLEMTAREDAPPPVSEKAPTHGLEDDEEHVGGNQYAGGTGGTGTAGLGGKAGPYRLDKGQDIHLLSEEEKNNVDAETQERARRMADEAYAKRLEAIGMSEFDAAEYERMLAPVASDVQQLRRALDSLQHRSTERVWQRQQNQGELDDNRLVDGVVGATNIYKRRGEDPAHCANQGALPKRIKFVMDLSGSMYTFNRLDGRLDRLLEVAILLFEALDGFESRYEYAMVGHSGSSSEEWLVRWGRPPKARAQRLELVQQMAAHAQFCWSGDHTLEASRLAIRDCLSAPADEYFTFIISDADLQRYNIRPEDLGDIMLAEEKMKAFTLFICANDLSSMK
eukprot:gene1590-2225_t